MNQLRKLFEPLTVGSMTIPNRFAYFPMGTPHNPEQYKNYASALAKGGCGLIVITHHIQFEGDDESVRFLGELGKAVHQYGRKICGHLGTGHGTIHRLLVHGEEEYEAVSVSDHFIHAIGRTARAMTIEEVHQYVRDVGETAERCYQAGWDAFELHIGMGYTLNRFLSTYSNRRTDEYGGSRENRMRMALESIEAIRSKVPRDFPLMCRFTPDEFMPGGLTWNDWKEMVPILDRAGINIWSVQPGWHESPGKPLVMNNVTPRTYLYMAEDLRKVTKNPIVSGYRVNDALVAEQILAEGKADLIGIGRQLMADPEFPNKAQEGRFDEIRPCLGTCFNMGVSNPNWRQCQMNQCTVSGRGDLEIGAALNPVGKHKKVFVIGGGAAGMEAAITAASRGHEVTLYEKGDRLGGKLIIGSVPPYKDEVRRLAIAMATQAEKAGVKVKLNTEVKSQLVLDSKPDAVIVATGAKPATIKMPGINGDNVITAIEALADVTKVGNKVVVIGGGLVGCETAEFLAAKGKAVTILELLPKLATDAVSTMRWVLKQRLLDAGVVLEMDLRATQITPEGVSGIRGRSQWFFPADTVVLAAGFSPNQELFRELQDKLPEAYLIGDCVKARNLRFAIEEGFVVGNKL